jgi:hypothetical protein
MDGWSNVGGLEDNEGRHSLLKWEGWMQWRTRPVLFYLSTASRRPRQGLFLVGGKMAG